MATEAPDAATKLRLVLDYVPCEACLAQHVQDQELLCSLCRRLDRQVAVCATTRTQVILERPEPSEDEGGGVLIAPAKAPAEPAGAPVPDAEAPVAPAEELRVVFRDAEPDEDAPPASVEIVIEPYDEDEAPSGLPVEVEPYEPPAPDAEAEPAAVEVETTPLEAEPPAEPEALPVEAAPLEEEAEPAPEPAEAPPRKRGFAGLFGRRKRQEAPAESEPEPDAEEDEEAGWDDVVSYEAPPAAEATAEPGDDDAFDDDIFGVADGPASVAEAEPAPAAAPAPPHPAPAPEADVPDDDFVFRPPATDEPADAPAAPEPPADDLVPVEEVPVEPEGENPWAPPPEFLADEDEAPVSDEAAAAETVVPDAPETVEEASPQDAVEDLPEEDDDGDVVETEIVEMEIVEDDEPAPVEVAAPEAEPEDDVVETEIVEMEIVEDDEPAPAAEAESPASDLFRLRGFDATHEAALASVGIRSLADLSGRDAADLAERTALAAESLQAWVHVADLVSEVGVPVDPAISLVNAGVPGPQGLRDMEVDDVVERVDAFGGHAVSAREIKRWKRRV